MLHNINPYYLIILYSFIGSLVTILTTIYIKNTNTYNYIFIRYVSDAFILLFIYFYILSTSDKQYIFSSNSFDIWKVSLFISLISFISFIIYIKILHKFGPSKTESITHSLTIIFTLLLSYFLLKNTSLNYKAILGIIIIIIGLNLLINNSKYL